MDTGKFVGLLVFGLVGILVVAAFLPMITEISSPNDTFTNDEYFITMDKVTSDDTDTHTIEWSGTDKTKIVVDGVDVYPTWESITIFAEEDNLLRCTKASAGYYLNFVGATQPIGYGSINDQSVTVTIQNGTITFAGVTSASTLYSTSSTFDTAYIINETNEGDYSFIMKTPSAKAYVKGDSEIYGIGYSSIGGVWQNIFSISGTIDDGIDVSLVSTTLDTDPVISNETTVSSTVTGYIDLYQFEKETFTATYNGTPTNLTYSYVIVPASVVAEKTVHADSTLSTVINLLPLIAVIGLFVFLVGEFLYTRYL